MDKETLNNYGWVTICVLVLAVMLALATPFGDFISDGFKATYEALANSSNNAISTVIPWANVSPSEPSPTVKFYQPYKTVIDGHDVEYVFFEDGSIVIFDQTDLVGECMPAGTCVYDECFISIDGAQGIINEDGSAIVISFDGGQSQNLALNAVQTKYISYNTYYAKDFDDGQECFVFHNDNTIARSFENEIMPSLLVYQYGEPTIKVLDYYFGLEAVYVHPSGKQILAGEFIYTITDETVKTNAETSLKFNQPYRGTVQYRYNEPKEIEIVFHEDGASEIYYLENGVRWGAMASLPHTNTYNGTEIWIDGLAANANISADGNTLTGVTDEFIEKLALTLSPVEVVDIVKNVEYAGTFPDGIPDTTILAYVDDSNNISITLNRWQETTVQMRDYGYYMMGVDTSGRLTRLAKHPNGTTFVLYEDLCYTVFERPSYSFTPSATFTDGTTLTWEELMLEENGVKYGYNASAIKSECIDARAFKDCTKLVSIILPEEIDTINTQTFSNCSQLTTITMSHKVGALNSFCFESCVSLNRINYQGYICDWYTVHRELGDGNFDTYTNHYDIYCLDGVESKIYPS